MTTKVKPLSGGSFANVSLDAVGRAMVSDSTIGALDGRVVVNAVQAANEWHNQPNNTAATMAAQKRANAVGISIEEV